jgi:hypothetical protein
MALLKLVSNVTSLLKIALQVQAVPRNAKSFPNARTTLLSLASNAILAYQAIHRALLHADLLWGPYVATALSMLVSNVTAPSHPQPAMRIAQSQHAETAKST